MEKFNNRISLILFLILVSCHLAYTQQSLPHPSSAAQIPAYSSLSQRLIDSTHLIGNIVSDQEIELAPGVMETDVHYTDTAGRAMHLFILQVDLSQSKVTMEVATPFNQSAFARQTVAAQAAQIDTATHQIIAAINADFFDMDTGVPKGIVHKNGVIIKNIFYDQTDKPQQALSYFGVTKGGKPLIGLKSTYAGVSKELYNATGSGVLLVNNHAVIPQPYTAIAPRTAIGYNDGDKLFIVVVDGRNKAYSNGMDYAQLSSIFMAFGVHKAVNLDGGGSSTFMTRNPVTNVLKVRNQPSDGAPRTVANAWLVYLK